MWLSAQTGVFFRKRMKDLQEAEHQDRDFVVGATLTLLALIIGFSFFNGNSAAALAILIFRRQILK
jgi:hypothetical protein